MLVNTTTHPSPYQISLRQSSKKVLEYCEYHQKDPLPDYIQAQDADEAARRALHVVISEWDKKFIDVDQAMLFDLINAADYLDMRDLYDLGCITVANMIKGKTPEEIRKTVNVVNDFTPGEKEQIIKRE